MSPASHPRSWPRITAANSGDAPSYGADPITARVERRFAEIFEREVAVFPVATGTAANALALAALTPPWGAVFCHEEAHIADRRVRRARVLCRRRQADRSARRRTPSSTPATIAARLTEQGVVHHAQPAAISICAGDRGRHALYAGRDRGARRARAPPRPGAPYGRRALRQCRGRARLHARPR